MSLLRAIPIMCSLCHPVSMTLAKKLSETQIYAMVAFGIIITNLSYQVPSGFPAISLALIGTAIEFGAIWIMFKNGWFRLRNRKR